MVDFKIDEENGQVSAGAEGAVEEVTTSSTPLLSLRNRRTEIVNELYIDIQVPRWDEPELFIRFRPISATKLNATIEKRRKQKSDDWSYLANADMLIDSCVGIYAVVDGDHDNKMSLRLNDSKGPWTKFDPDLAAALGVESVRATDTVNGLFLTEGVMIDVANKLFRWSNIANNEAAETF